MGYQKSAPKNDTNKPAGKTNTSKSKGSVQNDLENPVDLGEGLILTGLRIFKVNSQDRLQGFADITLNYSFVVKGLKILDGQNGLFLGMPAKEDHGEYYDQCYPITRECREALMNTICPLFE